MADSELHPVVQLLLGRMKSHPEEFEHKNFGRWQYALEVIQEHGSAEEVAALDEAMRVIRLEEAHVWALDELCNGEERRAEEKKQYAQKMRAMQTGYTQATPVQPMSLQDYMNQQSAAAAQLQRGIGQTLLGQGINPLTGVKKP